MKCKVDVSFLKRLRQIPSRKRATLLRLATPREINSVSEVCLNLLKGHLPVSKKILSQIKKHRNKIRKIGSKKLSVKKKKQILVQTGSGFLLPLLGAVIPFISSLLQKK